MALSAVVAASAIAAWPARTNVAILTAAAIFAGDLAATASSGAGFGTTASMAGFGTTAPMARALLRHARSAL